MEALARTLVVGRLLPLTPAHVPLITPVIDARTVSSLLMTELQRLKQGF